MIGPGDGAPGYVRGRGVDGTPFTGPLEWADRHTDRFPHRVREWNDTLTDLCEVSIVSSGMPVCQSG